MSGESVDKRYKPEILIYGGPSKSEFLRSSEESNADVCIFYAENASGGPRFSFTGEPDNFSQLFKKFNTMKWSTLSRLSLGSYITSDISLVLPKRSELLITSDDKKFRVVFGSNSVEVHGDEGKRYSVNGNFSYYCIDRGADIKIEEGKTVKVENATLGITLYQRS